MNEALRNIALMVWALSAINSEAYAGEKMMTISEESSGSSAPTLIYGASSKAPGVKDQVVVEQGSNEGNPFGAPIDTNGFESAADDNGDSASVAAKPQPAKPSMVTPQNVVSETLPQNPPISSSDTPEDVNQQIQNTLYESGNRVYDVQSYPVEDVNTITAPNTQPTINSYPSY